MAKMPVSIPRRKIQWKRGQIEDQRLSVIPLELHASVGAKKWREEIQNSYAFIRSQGYLEMPER